MQDKQILLVTEDYELASQIREISARNPEYRITSASSLKDYAHYNLIFCDYLLLPDAVFSNEFSFSNDVIVLFDIFEESSILHVLDCGTIGYILKPITAKILDALIRSFLRKYSSKELAIPEVFTFGDHTFHVLNLFIEHPGGKIHLTPSEAGILTRLLVNRGRLCLRKQLLDEIKSNNKGIVARNVDVHIASLRKKLGPYGDKISTVRGVGYLFTKDEDTLYS